MRLPAREPVRDLRVRKTRQSAPQYCRVSLKALDASFRQLTHYGDHLAQIKSADMVRLPSNHEIQDRYTDRPPDG